MKETNMEHFEDELKCFIKQFGVTRETGKIMACCDMDCDRCALYDSMNCGKERIKWLMSKYKPEPMLTEKERGFVECIETGYIVRDEDGILLWSDDKPYKSVESWETDFNSNVTEIDKTYFSFITWEDEELWSVEELRKLKVEK